MSYTNEGMPLDNDQIMAHLTLLKTMEFRLDPEVWSENSLYDVIHIWSKEYDLIYSVQTRRYCLDYIGD